LLDQALGTPVPEHFTRALRLALDDGLASGLLAKPVELVIRSVNGLPFGRFDRVVTAWNELVADEHCVVVAGPWLSENALALHSVIEAGEVPSLSMASVLEWHGENCFAFQNGAPPEDMALVIGHIAGMGCKSVAIVHEANSFGEECHHHARVQARRLGVRVVADYVWVAGGEEEATLLEDLRASGAQALVYLGYGFDGHAFIRLAGASDWNVPKLVGSILMGATTPEYGYGYELADFEGWTGVDQYDPHNPATQAFLDRYEKEHGERPEHSYATHGYDWGMTLVEALHFARPATPVGVRAALESVRNLPAVTGSAGTVIGFGPHDHRGYKGSRWVSLSTVEAGTIVKVP
jgi:branched-chain amino acid transport system substrate-binding protein